MSRIATRAPLILALALFAVISCSTPLRNAKRMAEEGDLQGAREVLLHAIQQDSTNFDLYMALGALDDSTGRHREAASAYSAALALDPTNESAKRGLVSSYLAIANALLLEGKRVAARDTLRLALKVDSTCARCWERLGDTYLAIDYASRALKYYTKASSFEQSSRLVGKIDSARARIARSKELTSEGFRLYEKRHWQTAESRFQQALKLNAENDSARYGFHMARGRRLYKGGRIKDLWQAISEFGHAAEIRPHAAEPHYWLARTYQKKDRNEFVNAIDEFEKAAQLEPNTELGRESAKKARELRALKKKLDEFWGR